MMSLLNHTTTPEEVASPIYEAGRRASNERYAVYQENARLWKGIAFFCLGITAISVTGNVWQGTQSKTFAFVVERDKLGDAVVLHPLPATTPTDPNALEAEVSEWVCDVRRVSTDALDEKRYIFKAFDHTAKGTQADEKLKEWFTANNPFERAKQEIVDCEVLSARIERPDVWNTWHVEWREDTRTRTGILQTSKYFEVTMTIAMVPPATDDEIRKNYNGMFVTNFDWRDRKGT